MWLLLTLGVGALVAACSNDDPDPGATTLPRATTTSTTSDADRYAIPDTITAEYVNDVLVALNHVYGDVVRKRIETRQLQPQDLIPLRAIYSEAEFQEQAAAIAQSPFRPPEAYQSPIGDRRISVRRVLTATPTCIAVEGTYDFTAILQQAPAPRAVWVTLRLKDAGTDSEGFNATPWSIASEDLAEVNRCVG